MKTFFQQILRGVKARIPKTGVFSRGGKNTQGNFNPAPSYWALIPVKPNNFLSSKKKEEF